MRRIRIGVVGVGFMGALHARVLATMPEVELVAVADRRVERAREVANNYNIPNALDDVGQLLDKVEGVVIASPESIHKGHALMAIEHDCHVLLEKPLAKSLEDGQVIYEKAQASRGIFMLGYLLRFDPRYVAGKKQVEKVGPITAIHACRRGFIDMSEKLSKWTHPLFYQAIHDIDVMHWYANEPAKEVYAVGSNRLLRSDIPEAVTAIIRFNSGAVASIDTNWVLPPEFKAALHSRIEVFGANGTVTVESLDQGVRSCLRNKGFAFPDVLHWPEVHGRIEGDLRRELEHFIGCIRTGDQPLSTVENGLVSLETALAMIKSMASEKPVAVNCT